MTRQQKPTLDTLYCQCGSLNFGITSQFGVVLSNCNTIKSFYTLRGYAMSNKHSQLAERISNHMRKAELLQKTLHNTNKLLNHELTCLHECLDEGRRELDVPEPNSVTTFGVPKEKPE